MITGPAGGTTLGAGRADWPAVGAGGAVEGEGARDEAGGGEEAVGGAV